MVCYSVFTKHNLRETLNKTVQGFIVLFIESEVFLRLLFLRVIWTNNPDDGREGEARSGWQILCPDTGMTPFVFSGLTCSACRPADRRRQKAAISASARTSSGRKGNYVHKYVRNPVGNCPFGFLSTMLSP